MKNLTFAAVAVILLISAPALSADQDQYDLNVWYSWNGSCVTELRLYDGNVTNPDNQCRNDNEEKCKVGLSPSSHIANGSKIVWKLVPKDGNMADPQVVRFEIRVKPGYNKRDFAFCDPRIAFHFGQAECEIEIPAARWDYSVIARHKESSGCANPEVDPMIIFRDGSDLVPPNG